MNLSTQWAAHLKDKESQHKFKEELKHYLVSPPFVRLREILDQKIKDLETQERQADYTIPSWSHKQAHINGQLSELHSIRKLLGT